MMLHKGVASTG